MTIQTEGSPPLEELGPARAGRVFAQASVSLDGYIAGPGDAAFDRLFAWCTAGDVVTPSADPQRLIYRTSAQTAAYLHQMMARAGALVVGRRLFDLTGGWGGSHPFGAVPVFVVTHHPPADWTNTVTPFVFVTDGVASAVRQALDAAGGKDVGIGPGSTVGQALTAGLLDELCLDVVPVVLGGGVRMLDGIDINTGTDTGTGTAPIDFDGPQVIAGTGVTHLIYRRNDQHGSTR